MKDILTTTDVAKLLGLHANTLKNWVREGKLPSFRTLGGHYRIKAGDLVAALKEKGIPVPEELTGSFKRVFVVHPDEDVRDELTRELKSAGAAATCFESGAEALMEVGNRPPGAVIWYTGLSDVEAASAARAILGCDRTKNVDLIFLNDNDSGATRSMLSGKMDEPPVFNYPEQTAEIISRIQRANK